MQKSRDNNTACGRLALDHNLTVRREMSEETNFETRRRKVGLFIILKLPVIVKAPVTS